MTFDDETFVGAGYVIRFIPSEELTYRGYDVNIAQTIVGRPFLNETIFLRTVGEVPDIRQGDLALVVANRVDRTMVFTPGECIPLVPISEAQLEEHPHRCAVLPRWAGSNSVELSALLAQEISASSSRLATARGSSPRLG